MMRDSLETETYFDRAIEHYEYEVNHRRKQLASPFKKESYRPQYTYDLAKAHFRLALLRYSRGDAISETTQYAEPLLVDWQASDDLGSKVWSSDQWRERHDWSINLDHYIDCFWLVGLALAFNIPDLHWQRLLVLIGNEGEDQLLDRIIATRSPDRKIGSSLCYPNPYARLLDATDAPKAKQAVLLSKFVERWYKEVGGVAKSGRQKQAVPFKAPYWHNYHRLEGAYFGYWCLEAVAAVKAFNLDDSLCVGHPHYPGDLLRPEQVTAPDVSRLLPELAATIGAPPEPPFTGEPRHLTKWEAFKMMVKSKLNS